MLTSKSECLTDVVLVIFIGIYRQQTEHLLRDCIKLRHWINAVRYWSIIDLIFTLMELRKIYTIIITAICSVGLLNGMIRIKWESPAALEQQEIIPMA